MRFPTRATAAAIATAFLLFHLPYLPRSLEDLDSINFALGLRHYDIAHHQPHPPGYPVFIVLGQVVRQVAGNEAHALALLGIITGALGVLALFALFRQLEDAAVGRAYRSDVATRPHVGQAARRTHRSTTTTAGLSDWIPWAAALVAATSPLYWFTASRPLSDTTGLAAAVAIQAWTLAAGSSASFAGAAFVAGVASGIRSQVVWLTLPLLAWSGYRRFRETTPPRSLLFATVASTREWIWAFAAGCLVWAVPMIAVTGGVRAYWRTVFSQGAEDLTGIQMLWTTPTPRVFVSALYYAFVAPWALWSIAVVAIVFALLGVVLMLRFWRPALVPLAIAFIPYLAFDLLFQETFTTRYALPLVVPVAYLAVRGAAAFGRRPGLTVAVALSVFDAHIGGTSVAAYAREPAPAFRMLEAMAATHSAPPPVLAMDRREQLDLRRPIAWMDDRMPRIAERLPSPPQHEWLELVNYWNRGGRNPAWFVADPLRTDIDLIQHDDPVQYRWPLPYPVLLSGIRPNAMDWYRIERPDWYAGIGWSLTPESAGVSHAENRGVAYGPIKAWVNRSTLARGASLVVGGRDFDAVRSRLRVRIASDTVADLAVGPGGFLHVARLPVLGTSGDEFEPLTVEAAPAINIGVEQFDIGPPGRVVFGFGDGWNEQEYDPALGRRWRWLSERGEMVVAAPRAPVRLHVEGESPRVYFSKPSRFTVRVGDRVAFDDQLSDDFALDITIPADLVTEPVMKIVLETDQVYVPAERSSRTRDRRHLGLRIFKCDLRVADR